jgi:hypothetical protein
MTARVGQTQFPGGNVNSLKILRPIVVATLFALVACIEAGQEITAPALKPALSRISVGTVYSLSLSCSNDGDAIVRTYNGSDVDPVEVIFLGCGGYQATTHELDRFQYEIHVYDGAEVVKTCTNTMTRTGKFGCHSKGGVSATLQVSDRLP